MQYDTSKQAWKCRTACRELSGQILFLVAVRRLWEIRLTEQELSLGVKNMEFMYQRFCWLSYGACEPVYQVLCVELVTRVVISDLGQFKIFCALDVS